MNLRKSQKKGLFVGKCSLAILICFGFIGAGPCLGKTLMTGVFTGSKICPGKMCLHGKFAPHTEVLLLAKNTDETCLVKTAKAIIAKIGETQIQVTPLKRSKSCKLSAENVFLAVFEKKSAQFKVFDGDELTGEEFEAMDKALKSDKLFSTTWKKDKFYPEGDKEQAPYKISDYRAFETEITQYKLKSQRLYLARQKLTDGSNFGIAFASLKGTWSTVSSGFTIQKPIVFTIDTRVFVAVQVSCQLACGYVDNQIYEFNGRKFKLIYSNSDLSTEVLH
jgi:hypothetical protein